MKSVYAAALLTVASLSAVADDTTPADTQPQATAAVALDTLAKRYSYVTGYQMAAQLRFDKSELDADAMTQGMLDVLKGQPLAMSIEEMRAVLVEYQQERARKRAAASAKNREQAKNFLAEQAEKAGVTKLDSGILYSVIESGDGKQAAAGGNVTVHYEGTLIDGTVFDSSYQRGKPATFNLGQVIKGWQEIVPLMKEGDKWNVIIPSELAYGTRGSGNLIGPDATLKFAIELISVN